MSWPKIKCPLNRSLSSQTIEIKLCELYYSQVYGIRVGIIGNDD